MQNSRLTLVCLLLVVATAQLFAQTANPAITSSELREHVRYLASDEMEGRASGAPGNTNAAIYIAGKLKLWGLKPAGDNGTFFQFFEFVSNVKLGEQNEARLESESLPGGSRKLRIQEDFRPLGFSSSGTASGPVVFAGYGISAPDKSYDDYAGMDVKGKVVLVLRYAPDGSSNTSDFNRYTSLRNKARVARDRGAAALVIITGPNDAPDDDLIKLAVDQGAGSSGLPVVCMKRELFAPLFRTLGLDLKSVQDSIKSTRKTQSMILGDLEMELTTDVIKVTTQTANVMAYLEGNDPARKTEAVVLGAHFDHLGFGGSGSMAPDTVAIHNGADDNASGTATLLEMAEAFASRKESIKRSFLFVFFSGEELGTLGSQHYVSMPFYPLNQTVAMLNMDMVGRMQNKSLTVGGTGTSPVWASMLNELNTESAFTLSMNPDGFGPSDHASFYGKDVPVLFFYTGVHDDYHKPSDDWDKLNYDGHEKVSRYVARIASALDTMQTRPAFTRVAVSASRSTGGDSRGFAVTLGIVPDVGESSAGMKISGVRPNGPAEKAGLKTGDILVRMAGKTILNVYDYMGVLGELKVGDTVPLEILRDGTPMTVSAVMQKRN